ncbi:MAG: glycosyltransferase, partial [Chloroflexota bacterium]
LNNDTVVTPGWLAALQAAAERTPDAGIVSGKIIGPDGRVQLAGAYIAFDGSARMIGEGLSPEDPSLATEREVCYVGGHCMLIRREVIESIGLLDDSYGFGYHEDTDYCYRARQAGFRVIYTPDCVIHHQLFGTPLPERQKIIQKNQQHFLERWSDKLFLWRSIRNQIEFRASEGELPVGAGWYAAESEYTCIGRDAWCYLLHPTGSPAVMELIASAAHPDLIEKPVRLDVLANGKLVGHAFFTNPWELRQLFFPIPELAEERLRVDLKVDRSWRPDELFQDGRDPREIGLAIYRMAVGDASTAATWAAKGVPQDRSIQRLRDHLKYLEQALADKDDFYQRELEGKERLIAQLQGNLERYHATLPFRLYFTAKKMLSKSGHGTES